MKVNFEELTMLTTQIEACLNSWPLTQLPENTDEIETLTPGHFMIRCPLEVLPDSSSSHRLMPESKCCHHLRNAITTFLATVVLGISRPASKILKVEYTI